MIAQLVEVLIRAAATQYALGVRQFWLYGLKESDPLMRQFAAASYLRYRRRPS